MTGVDYTGIAVGKSDGTLYASTDYIGLTTTMTTMS